MTEMVDDETIYDGFIEQLSDKETKIVGKVLTIWADSLDKLPENEKTLKIVFTACINAIASMGPAYCKVAVATLLHHVHEQDEEDQI